MKTTAILIASIAALSACSNTGSWKKGGASPKSDVAFCQYDAAKHAPYDGIYGKNTTAEESIFIQCMRSKGWTWVVKYK